MIVQERGAFKQDSVWLYHLQVLHLPWFLRPRTWHLGDGFLGAWLHNAGGQRAVPRQSDFQRGADHHSADLRALRNQGNTGLIWFFDNSLKTTWHYGIMACFFWGKQPLVTRCSVSFSRTSGGRLQRMPPTKRRLVCEKWYLLSSFIISYHCDLIFCDPAQKAAQLSEDGHILLHDVCCLWVWLLPKLLSSFPGNTVKQHEELFHKGFLGSELDLAPAKLWMNLAGAEKIPIGVIGSPRNPSQLSTSIWLWPSWNQSNIEPKPNLEIMIVSCE